tara:strand:+ start:87 stop:443 length:357 start_codon:yes stop_codon:yes gene_type:complete
LYAAIVDICGGPERDDFLGLVVTTEEEVFTEAITAATAASTTTSLLFVDDVMEEASDSVEVGKNEEVEKLEPVEEEEEEEDVEEDDEEGDGEEASTDTGVLWSEFNTCVLIGPFVLFM